MDTDESDVETVNEPFEDDEERETLTDLENEMREMLARPPERPALRPRAILPPWPARDPNAVIPNTPPVCYRRGERFMPYDLQLIVASRVGEFFARQANAGPNDPPLRQVERSITIAEREMVRRQLDLQYELELEREGNEDQPMREIEPIDIPEPPRMPPVPMPQDQPEYRQNYDVPCVCCTERKVNTIFMPCRHACYCWTCAMDNEYYDEVCYMCRTKPEYRANMYGP
jgi:hypothetical protein